MRNIFIVSLLLFLSNQTFAQFKVDTVELIETVNNKYLSKIPKLVSKSKEKTDVPNKINTFILDRFMIESFNQAELKEFRWYEVDFDHEIKNDILFIAFSGEYYGAYPNMIREELFFDLNTGEELANLDIPFHALFSLHGYLDFMNRFWIDKTEQAFKKAIDCAEYEPYCSYYDIMDYTVDDRKIMFSLTDDCYARVSSVCSPKVSLTLPLDSIKNYLSTEGAKIIISDSYTSKKGIDKFLYNSSLKESLANNVYLFGKIDGKYPFSMALRFEENSSNINGYYYYDSKRKNLQLSGVKKNAVTIVLHESVDGSETGSFQINMSDSYEKNAYTVYNQNGESIHLTGTWSNPQKNKNYPVEFTEVKMNKEIQ